jgi:hypothetical protein
MTTVVAFMGPAGAGKSTAARYMVDQYGARSYSFARPLKEMARAIWDFSDTQLYGTQAEKEAVDPRWNMSPRTALQKLGTDAIRKTFGPGVWTDLCLNEIRRDSPRIAVIEDCRFQNESQAVLSLGRSGPLSLDIHGKEFVDRAIRGVVIRLDCPDRRSSDAGIHSSEVEWRTAPYTACMSVTLSEGVPVLQARLAKHLESLGVY